MVLCRGTNEKELVLCSPRPMDNILSCGTYVVSNPIADRKSTLDSHFYRSNIAAQNHPCLAPLFSHNDAHAYYTCNPNSNLYRNRNPEGNDLCHLTRVLKYTDTGYFRRKIFQISVVHDPLVAKSLRPF